MKSISLLAFLGLVTSPVFVNAQILNTIPATIQSCYKNATALNRYNRQPMHITNLITIIRKIEQKSLHFRDMKRLARTITKRFQFDGIYFDPDKSLELQFSPHPLESLKNTIIHDLIPDNAEILETDTLDNDERCALHWMVSHSLNTTLRDDETIERFLRLRENGGLRAKRASNLWGNDRNSKRPIETGTVYTNWGPISAGRVIAGIAAGLMEKQIPVIFKSFEPGNGYNPNNGGNGNRGGNDPNNWGGSGNGGRGGNDPNGWGNNGGGSRGGNDPNNWGSNGGNGRGGNNPNNWGNNPNNPQYNNQWQSHGRKKRQAGITFQELKNIHAATLAGDVGQAAILNAPYFQRISSLIPPIGTWNDGVCPREYVLNALPDREADPSRAHDTWSYMTGAEIRGGIDGLILGTKATDLSAKGFTLSQLLEMYYSEEGIYGESGYRSCDRVNIFPSTVDQNVVKDQSRSFAYYYNTKVQKIIISEQTISTFTVLVDQTFSKMQSFLSVISSDPMCKKRAGSPGVSPPDQDKEVKPMAMVYAVLDHSTTRDELIAQQQFVGKLAFDLNVSPKGSRLGLVDGRTGQVLISPNYTDNAPILACKIVQQQPIVQPGNLPQVLRSLKTELTRLRDEQQRRNDNSRPNNRILILIFVQGKKLEAGQRESILGVLKEYEKEFGDVQVTYTSSRFQKADFQDFMLDKNDDANFVPIQSPSGNMSDASDEFMKELMKRSPHGALNYLECNEIRYPNQSNELKRGQTICVKPETIKFYKISPSSFFSSVDLRLRFTSELGKIRVCVSRRTKFPLNYNEQENDKRRIECKITSGTYVSPETGKKDIEFIYTKPCAKREREGCDAIYVSITPTEVPGASGGVGPDCSNFGCECDTPDQVRVTWTHYDMRCNGAFKMAKPTTAITSAFLLLVFLYKFL